MPKDPRLFMTFPIDMHRHPKVQRLDPAVRWTFFEMNGEARIADNDGRFAKDDAEFMWPVEHLAALVASHPTRPLVKIETDAYVIRDYAEHQHTRADRESLSSKRAEAGKKGAEARWGANGNSMASAKREHGKPRQRLAESESESESEDLSTHVLESQSLDTRAREMTDSMSTVVKGMASRAGITDMAGLIVAIHEHTRCVIEPAHAVALTNDLVDRAKGEVKSPQRYVVSCLRQSPGEIEQHIYESRWAA